MRLLKSMGKNNNKATLVSIISTHFSFFLNTTDASILNQFFYAKSNSKDL